MTTSTRNSRPTHPPSNSSWCTTPGCEHPTHHRMTVCAHCLTTYETALIGYPDPAHYGMAALETDLNITIARQQRTGDRRPLRKAPPATDESLAYGKGAADALRQLTITLVTWQRVIRAETRIDTPQRPIRRGLAAHAAQLLDLTDQTRYHPSGGGCIDDVCLHIHRAWEAVDPGHCDTRTYAGPCDCGRDLRHHPSDTTVHCRCGALYNTAERREWLIEIACEELLTSTQISDALPAFLGRPIPAATVRSWIGRHRLHDKGPNNEGHRLFRFGDALDLARRTDTTR